jgi:hypothetical protein
MPTVDRSPGAQYLSQTLANLTRAGVFTSPRLHSMHLIDSGVGDWPYPALNGEPISVHRPAQRRGPSENCAEALRIGALTLAPWVLYLEDDIDVCADFLGSVGRWLDDVERVASPSVYKLTCNHVAMTLNPAKQRGWCTLPAAQTWSTVAMALRSDVAMNLSEWLHERPLYTHENGRVDVAYDMEMHNWAASVNISEFVISVPSFVQHIASNSAIRPGDRRIIRFPTWPGRDWSYNAISSRSSSNA